MNAVVNEPLHLRRHAGKQLVTVENLARLNCQEPASALLPPSTPFYEPADTTDLLYLRRSVVPRARGRAVALFAMPFSIAPFSSPPPVAVHDISTMETARASSLLSHSTSAQDEALKSAPDQPILSCSPLIFPLPCLSPSPYSSSMRSVFRVDRGGIERFIYSPSARFHFLSPREIANSGRTSQSFSWRFVG